MEAELKKENAIMKSCIICGEDYKLYDTYQPSPICPECRKKLIRILYADSAQDIAIRSILERLDKLEVEFLKSSEHEV